MVATRQDYQLRGRFQGYIALAHDQITALLRKCTFPNLFDTHPRRGGDIAIFQIDGNFGGTAGIAEMLTQSHETEADGTRIIELLPALPKEWPNGSVTGLLARGGFEVSVQWRNEKLGMATIHSRVGGAAKVCYQGKIFDLKLPAGEKIQLRESDFR